MKRSPLKTSLSDPSPVPPLPPPPVEPPPGHSRDRTPAPSAAGRVDPRHRDSSLHRDARPAVSASEAPQRLRARHFIGKAIAHHRSRPTPP